MYVCMYVCICMKDWHVCFFQLEIFSVERIHVIGIIYSRNNGTSQNITSDKQTFASDTCAHVPSCMHYPVLGNRRHINYIFVLCVLFFTIFLGLVDAADDAAPGTGVCIQLHGRSLGGKLKLQIWVTLELLTN